MIRGSRQSGFSLLEALVGLTIIAVAILLTMSLLAQQPAVELRIAAHQETLRLMEMEMEILRSEARRTGGGEPEDGPRDLSGLPPPTPERDLRMWVEMSRRPERSLYEIKLKARYFVQEKIYERTLRSLVFTP